MEGSFDLVLDIGNSSTKAALFHGHGMRWVERVPHGVPEGLPHLAARVAPARITIGSVASEGLCDMDALRAIAPVHVITPEGGMPIPSNYATPASLGVDRMANAVAASLSFPGRAVLAIDAGSCITYDLVDASGTYLGGAISPGMAMRARAMHAFSARLPLVQVPAAPALLGCTTDECLASGIHHGMVAEVRGFMAAFREYHPGLAVILTGGDAPRFAAALKFGIFADPSLTLRGLYAILLHQAGPPIVRGAARPAPPSCPGT